MRARSLPSMLAASIALAAGCAGPDQGELAPDTAYADAATPAVIAFVPPPGASTRATPGAAAAEEPDASATRALVESAVADTQACLGATAVSYRVVSAQRIVVRGGGRDESFDLGHTAPLVGALLLRPGMNSRILFAGGGPQALGRMLRPAASEYFGIPCIG